MGPDEEPLQQSSHEVTETVDALGPDSTGTWVIITRHTRHILDLVARTYRREPGSGATPMLHDNRTVALTRVTVWARVNGIQVVWFDDPDVPELFEHWRQSSPITEIRRLPPSQA